MKEIKAVFQPFMLHSVLAGLREVEGLPAATVSEVRGFGVVHPECESQTKTKLEIMVLDGMVDLVVAAIQKHAHTGNPGDGRIFVIPVEDTIKIRTEERDTAT